MRVMHGLEGLRQITTGAIVSVGNFDGMHLGHLALLRAAGALRREQPVAVVTFEPHPLTTLRPEAAPPRLTPPAMKQQLIEQQHVDELVMLAPTPEMLNLEAEAFLAILRDEVRISHIVEGTSFSFGKNRAGTIERLREWTIGSPLQLHIIEALTTPLLNLHVVPVNSSMIRWLLGHGRVRDAAICLGRSYGLSGTVVQGEKRGRALGVPTANLGMIDQLIPSDGIYAARCEIDGNTWPAALSIGTNPTFDGGMRTVEAHLIGYDGDLYDRVLQIDLIDWLREQYKFADPRDLVAQIRRDVRETADRFHLAAWCPIAELTGST